MNFRHKIVGRRAQLDTVSYEKVVGEFTSPPVLSGYIIGTGDDARLDWTAAEATFQIYGYELFIDGSYHTTVNSQTYIHEGLNFGQIYDYKVRAVGPLGIVGTFSNTVSLTGSGLPSLDLSAYGEFLGSSVKWNDVSENSYYTIEGYNVYFYNGATTDPSLMTKVNSSLLGLNVDRYGRLGLSEGSTVTWGVSYEYDGGQESTIQTIQVQITSIPKEFNFILGEDWLFGYNTRLVSAATRKAAINVVDGANITLVQIGGGPNYWEYKNSVIGLSFGDYELISWSLDNNGRPPWIFRAYENCNPIILNQWGYLGFAGKLYASRGPLVGKFNGFSGITVGCPDIDARNTKTFWKLQVRGGSNDIVSNNIEEFMNATGWGSQPWFRGWEVGSGGNRLTASIPDATTGTVQFTIRRYVGLPFWNLYIKADSDPSYGSPNNGASVIKDWGGHYRTISGLSAGTYNAKVIYCFVDGSEYTGVESNEVTFTVT